MGVLFKNNRCYSGGKLLMSPECYSTEEREVGVWTDGKPLYQKTVVNTSSLIVGNNSISIPTGIDKIVSAEGVFISGSYACDLNYFASTSSGTLALDEFNTTNNTIRVRIGADYSTLLSGAKVYVTLQYTKTTDTAGSGVWTPSGVLTCHYSTAEHIIGTWADGSTLYERTLTKTVTTGTSPIQLFSSSDLPGVLQIVDIQGFFKEANDVNTIPINMYINNSSWTCAYVAGQQEIYGFAKWSSLSTLDLVLTIRYTKSSS